MTWSDAAILILGTALMLDFVLHWYLRNWTLDKLECYFPNNPEVQAEKRFWWWNTFMNKSFRLGSIIRYFVRPKTMIRRGEVTEEELATVPLSLKRRLIAYHYFSTVQGTCLFTWYVWTKLL